MTTKNRKEISINCWKCDKPSSQRWVIDPNYIVCPQCMKLHEITERHMMDFLSADLSCVEGRFEKVLM